MKAVDLRKKTIEELESTVKDLKKDSQEAVIEMIKGKEKDTSKIGKMKKDLARVVTVLNEKKILAQEDKHE